MKTFALAAVIALLAAPAFAEPAFAAPVTGDATITLTFDTAASTGQVMVALYGAEDAFARRGAPVASAIVNVAAGQHSRPSPSLPATMR